MSAYPDEFASTQPHNNKKPTSWMRSLSLSLRMFTTCMCFRVKFDQSYIRVNMCRAAPQKVAQNISDVQVHHNRFTMYVVVMMQTFLLASQIHEHVQPVKLQWNVRKTRKWHERLRNAPQKTLTRQRTDGCTYISRITSSHERTAWRLSC